MGVDTYVKSFNELFKNDNVISSRACAEETIKVLIKIISNSEWRTANAGLAMSCGKRTVDGMIKNRVKWQKVKAKKTDLLHVVSQQGKLLMDPYPSQIVIGNMVKRVLKVVRDEYISAMDKNEEGGARKNEERSARKHLQKLKLAEGPIDYSKDVPSLKESIIDCLRELLSEMETGPDNIAAQSLDYILSDMVIMTAGKSQTIEKFLKKAFSKRKFKIIVAEGAPSYHGQELAKNLAQHGIDTTVIHDSAIFAVMSRVNKVIIGASCVMANGGLKAECGLHALALAAKYYSIPLIVCSPAYKLTPQFLRSADQEGFNHLMSPQDVIPFEDGEIVSNVEVLNPAFDYIPPELVTMHVSNIGDSSPSYIHKLLAELYHSDDYDID